LNTSCPRSNTWQSDRATSSSPGTRTCNMRCLLRLRCGAEPSAKASPMLSPA
jgi:hypothetical protein